MPVAIQANSRSLDVLISTRSMAEAARRCNVRDTPWKRIQNVLINNDLKITQQTECILQIFLYQQIILRINDSKVIPHRECILPIFPFKQDFTNYIRTSLNRESVCRKYFYINKNI